MNLWLTCHAFEGHSSHELGLWSSSSSSAISSAGKIIFSLVLRRLIFKWILKAGNWARYFCNLPYTSEINMVPNRENTVWVRGGLKFLLSSAFPHQLWCRNPRRNVYQLYFNLISQLSLWGKNALLSGIHGPLACRVLCLSVRSLTEAREQSIQGLSHWQGQCPGTLIWLRERKLSCVDSFHLIRSSFGTIEHIVYREGYFPSCLPSKQYASS